AGCEPLGSRGKEHRDPATVWVGEPTGGCRALFLLGASSALGQGECPQALAVNQHGCPSAPGREGSRLSGMARSRPLPIVVTDLLARDRLTARSEGTPMGPEDSTPLGRRHSAWRAIRRRANPCAAWRS